MKFIIDCPLEKFDRCKAVIYREMKKRSTKDPDSIFKDNLQQNVGGDTFLVVHEAHEITVELLDPKVIPAVAKQMGIKLEN